MKTPIKYTGLTISRLDLSRIRFRPNSWALGLKPEKIKSIKFLFIIGGLLFACTIIAAGVFRKSHSAEAMTVAIVLAALTLLTIFIVMQLLKSPTSRLNNPDPTRKEIKRAAKKLQKSRSKISD